ncbi:MAG TPA: glycoside hydrolase family 2 TIM barrel-domain containing protein [Pilimelia sp.]|nr:glycoside hydrolase family 2 TIM barrel-domain containing protein [Pilimelia sp.]
MVSRDVPGEPPGVDRRTVLAGAAGVAAGIAAEAALRPGGATAAPAVSVIGRRVVYNLNVDWRFSQQNVAGAEAISFNDAGWSTVSVPHTFNDVDSFDEWITSSGEHHVARQVVWYRKRFTLPADLADRKIFIECEGVRQAATVYVNGAQVGLYEGGVVPFGFDITSRVRFGAENVLAIRADNSASYPEQATGTVFQWDSRDFNPNFGGLTRNLRLIAAPRTYFTLPLYNGLRTTGTYVYPTSVNVAGQTATINVEAQVRNEQSTARTVTVSANVLQPDGQLRATIPGAPVTIAAGQTQVVRLSGRISQLSFWQPGRPALYTVEMVLTEAGAVQDVVGIVTGFRKAEFRGGAAAGGVYINDRYTYLTGYAQRSPNEWALVGGAVPDWLRDYDGQLVRDSNANLIRWMHIAAQPACIRMTDRYGIVSVQPAGDKEKDTTGRQWDQRVEAMRDTIIYFRNSPSILFWEAGNNWITAAHMQQMRQLRVTWDPHGMRVMGCRAISDDPGYGGTATVDQAEYTGTMLNRHYSDYARDRHPIIESEYTRDEAPRRVWDNSSPPDFGYRTGPEATWHWNSEEFAGPVAASTRYEFWSQRIQGPGNRRYAGSAALIWSDSNQHGRQYGCETSRLSGRVDAVRLPKESYFTHRVMQSSRPDIHLIGHWTYPAGTTKTMYVMAANVARVALFVNGAQVATSTSPSYDFLYTFPGIAWRAGTIAAVGYDAGGAAVVRQEKQTAGAATALRLTARTAPGGLRADGSDVFFVDIEVVDAQGRRLPTDQARVDFTVSGPAVLLGGYNPGKQYSVFKPSVDTECGINRIFVRATRTAGTITVRATRAGLTAGAVTVTSSAVSLVGGLTTRPPDGY